MKPKDLKYPYSWKQRCIHYENKVLFVPDHYESYDSWEFPGWESEAFFGNNNPVYVEYCSGNGDWLIEKALENPDINWVAVEKKFERVRKIWSKKHNNNLDNIIIICGEAQCTTSNYFPKQSISKTFINFPDPWPKRKHHKHRLCNKKFFSLLCTILKNEGTINFVTDHEGYRDYAIAAALDTANLSSKLAEPFFVKLEENYGDSFFQSLWKRQGFNNYRVEFSYLVDFPSHSKNNQEKVSLQND
jgi:tRNA (guanine-N7-)-methyltransferase